MLIGTSLTYRADTAATVTQLYKPWGETRYSSGTLPTDYTYTGQYSHTDDFGLMYYNARWYDPALGRMAQADTIVPGAGNPMAWDRYSYAGNNPMRYTDPSGHWYYDPGCDCLVDTEDNSGNENPENLDYEIDYNEDEGNPLEELLGDRGRGADYKTFSFGGGGIIGGHVSITNDRYDNWYIGLGLDFGKSILGFSGNWVGGFMIDGRPMESELETFLTGLSGQWFVIPLVYIGGNGSSAGYAHEVGIGVPGIGVGGTYTWQINP